MTWWQRLLHCWRLWRDPERLAQYAEWDRRRAELVTGMALAELLRSPTYQAAEYAVRKVVIDPGLKAKSADVKRTEALVWMGLWAKEHEVLLVLWKARLLLEMAVAVESHSLPGPG